jgi:hypothetical protein
VERRPEGGKEPKLITRDPESYVLNPARSRVPLLMGFTNCEYNYIADLEMGKYHNNAFNV